MTPPARLAAAIALLDQILGGVPAEKALTAWGRASRFAGSGDRAAIRDLVYDALRCRRSFAALGGAEDGRGLILGGLRAAGTAPETLFTGEGHAPAPLGPRDIGRAPQGDEGFDLPDWLMAAFRDSLGAEAEAVALALRQRAPVFLRVNRARSDLAGAVSALAAEEIEARPHPLAHSALEVIRGQRRIQTSRAYLSGLVELQDAASQAVAEALPLQDGMRVLDFCAGGGGKSLAMAARARLRLFAHDAAPQRMRDLPPRAKRAGAEISLTDRPEALPAFDLVLADAPCSGSGSWRRDPQGKWLLTPDRLNQITGVQDQILDRIAGLVRPGGILAYATCSLLQAENEARIDSFISRSAGFKRLSSQRFTPLQGGDGFFLACLKRE